jgi:CubicO group peptidase (beta-lactamase class C family)
MRPCLRVAVLFVLFHCPATPQSPDKAAKIDQLARQYADCCEFTGTVLVSEHDKVIFKSGYGFADREWNIPNAPDVKFRLGSITKQFTSMLIVQQVAKGTIKLDGHISDYLPYYRKDTGSRVTITQLLDHTSGIPSYTDDPKFFPDVSRNFYAVDDFVTKFCSGDLQFEPGSKFHYDNSGYFLLGAILEHVTGKKYEVLLQENILTPVGMHDTGYDHWSTIIPKRASGYSQTLDGIVNAAYLDMSLPYSAGSLYSTVEDLYKWDQALYTDKLLSTELRQKLFTPNLEQYGFGWVIRTVPKDEPGAGKTIIAHSGGINGFNTNEVRIIDDHDLILIFNNTPGASLNDFAKGILAILYGQEPTPPKHSLIRDLRETVRNRNVDAAIAQYQERKAAKPPQYDFNENVLNQLGYELLEKDRVSDAITVFKLNAEEYPKSANVYDSLGEAYAKAGNKQLAMENYQRALELDPNDQSAVDHIKELQKP